jgi:hypothetical protein
MNGRKQVHFVEVCLWLTDLSFLFCCWAPVLRNILARHTYAHTYAHTYEHTYAHECAMSWSRAVRC